jgi:hypothetical protein
LKQTLEVVPQKEQRECLFLKERLVAGNDLTS